MEHEYEYNTVGRYCGMPCSLCNTIHRYVAAESTPSIPNMDYTPPVDSTAAAAASTTHSSKD